MLTILISGVLLAVLSVVHTRGHGTRLFGWVQMAFAIFAMASWHRVTGRYVDLYSLFFAAVFFLHCGQSALWSLGLEPGPSSTFLMPFDRDVMTHALLLTTGALMALHLGALLGVALYHRRRSAALPRADDGPGGPQTDRLLRRAGGFVLALTVVPAAIVLGQRIAVVHVQGYMGLFRQEYPTGFANWYSVAASFLVPGALLLLAGSRGRPLGVLCAWLAIAGDALVLLYTGSRGVPVQALAAAGWLHHSVIAPIKKKGVALAAGGGVVVLALVALVRTEIGTDSFVSIARGARKQMGNPAVSLVDEIGASFRTVAYTVELVPKERDYDYGLGYANAMLAAVPNLFWDVHPAVKRGKYADWLIQSVAPAQAAQGFGWGFSVIAEAYLNFAWVGALAFMALVGCALGAFVTWASHRRGTLHLAIEAILISSVLWWARGESMNVTRAIAWQCVIPYFAIRHMAAAGRARQRARTPQRDAASSSPT